MHFFENMKRQKILGCSKGVESQFIYVAQLGDGSHVTYTPEEFAKKFGWKNDPTKARLMKLEP